VKAIDQAQFAERTYADDKAVLFRRLGREGRQPLTGVHFGEAGEGSASLVLAPGEYKICMPGDDQGPVRLVASGAPSAGEQRIDLRVSESAHLTPRDIHVAPGPVRIEVTSAYPNPDWGLHIEHAGAPKNWVSAAYITSLQDFRDLFTGEFLAADRTFAIRNITLMFTDITGSTEMYERLGDARAFALVQQHFELMTGVIRRREGGIVKTIGDAVMAAFPVNANALMAAMEIQRGFAEVSPPLNQIAVKIGLHRGATIAVTSNRMLDYFGRTVNIAARVQSASESGEVLATDAVTSDPSAAAWLTTSGIESRVRAVQMKGIAGEVRVASLKATR